MKYIFLLLVVLVLFGLDANPMQREKTPELQNKPPIETPVPQVKEKKAVKHYFQFKFG